MGLLEPALLFELVIHVPPPGRPAQRYTTRFPEQLTVQERQYVAAHLMGHCLEACKELGVVPKVVVDQ